MYCKDCYYELRGLGAVAVCPECGFGFCVEDAGSYWDEKPKRSPEFLSRMSRRMVYLTCAYLGFWVFRIVLIWCFREGYYSVPDDKILSIAYYMFHVQVLFWLVFMYFFSYCIDPEIELNSLQYNLCYFMVFCLVISFVL